MVKPSVAVTSTVPPEIVPPIMLVLLVTLASPSVASIFESAWVVKLLVALTFTVLPEILPPILPDWLEVVTLSVPVIVEPVWVVNSPDDAVKLAVLLVIFATLKLPVFAVTVTAPLSALMSPLISPD